LKHTVGSHQLFRIGFVIDSQYPNLLGAFTRECGFLNLFTGFPSNSPVGFMRFGWIADAVNRVERDLHYELFRPFRRYDAVVFLKSMGKDCITLAQNLKKQGVKIVFDANVDYLTPAEGTFYYEGMAPTEAQRLDMLDMLNVADAVIADSELIAKHCQAIHPKVNWISDSVKMDLVPRPRGGVNRDRLTVLWSGTSCKVFELLLIAPILLAHAERLRLVLVTDEWSGVERCFEPYQQQVKDLLAGLEHEIIRFRSIEQLLSVYTDGNLFVAPRFLDNTYNMGHTEWKITLPMACGRFVLASPQPSYLTVFARSNGKGLRICSNLNDWSREMNAVLGGTINLEEEGKYGRRTVETYYATEKIARVHAVLMRQLLHMNGASHPA